MSSLPHVVVVVVVEVEVVARADPPSKLKFDPTSNPTDPRVQLHIGATSGVTSGVKHCDSDAPPPELKYICK